MNMIMKQIRNKNMERVIPLPLLLVFILITAAAAAYVPLAAYGAETETAADENPNAWNEDYYRAADSSKSLSAVQQQDLDEICLNFMRTWQADLSLLAVRTEDYEGSTLEETARGYYESSGFGYGENRDGFQMAWDMDTDEVVIVAFGAAKDMIPDSYLEFVESTAARYSEKYGVYGPMYAVTRLLSSYLSGDITGVPDQLGGSSGETASPDAASGDESSSSQEVPEISEALDDAARALELREQQDTARETSQRPVSDQIPDASLRVGEGSDLPAWYPKDPASFPLYHDENAPRIVDNAGLFSEEEETAMETRISEIRRQLEKDIVVFTDVSTYGFSHMDYCDDFYDFNGYGVGADREGFCLMICMDPADRGGWTSGTGPVTMGLHTEEAANQLDDMLYDYLGSGQYYTGVADWIENIRRLYTTGSPYSESWALQSPESIERFHNPDASRVVDDARLLSGAQLQQLSEKAAELSEKYGLDIVIHTARNEGIVSRDDYSGLFYRAMGYGTGENYDGILLTVFKRPGYSADTRLYACGKGLEKLTEVNEKRLLSRFESALSSEGCGEAAMQWLDQTDHMLRTGRAPLSDASWRFTAILASLAGLIFGGSSLGRARTRMATPKIQEHADSYILEKSLKIRNLADQFLNSTTTKTYSPRPKESSSRSSSSGHSSSYSSSHTSHSGSSHSGSGRRF